MRFLLCGVLWLSFLTLWSQNLVPNPGFEEYIKCPGSYMLNQNEFAIHGWQSPTSGTPDHFHSCSSGEADVPVNWAGIQMHIAAKGMLEFMYGLPAETTASIYSASLLNR